MTAANEMVNLGLKDACYEYVNRKKPSLLSQICSSKTPTSIVDDCWAVEKNDRSPITHELIPDPVKFLDGIHGLAEQIQALGVCRRASTGRRRAMTP